MTRKLCCAQLELALVTLQVFFCLHRRWLSLSLCVVWQSKMINNGTKLLSKTETITENRACESPKIKFKDAIPQIVASCAINFIVVQAGINMAFSSILIPQLAKPESDIEVDLDSSSNIASIVTVSVACGALVCGTLMDRLGRMRLSTMICAPFVVGWLLIALSRNLYMIYAARVLSGFCGGVYKLQPRL